MNFAQNVCGHRQNNQEMIQLACMAQIADTANSLKNSLEAALQEMRALYGE